MPLRLRTVALVGARPRSVTARCRAGTASAKAAAAADTAAQQILQTVRDEIAEAVASEAGSATLAEIPIQLGDGCFTGRPHSSQCLSRAVPLLFVLSIATRPRALLWEWIRRLLARTRSIVLSACGQTVDRSSRKVHDVYRSDVPARWSLLGAGKSSTLRTPLRLIESSPGFRRVRPLAVTRSDRERRRAGPWRAGEVSP